MCCIALSCRALVEDDSFDRMVGGKTRNPVHRPDCKFTIGKTTTNRRNLQGASGGFPLRYTGHGGNSGNSGDGDEVDKKPVRADPVRR